MTNDLLLYDFDNGKVKLQYKKAYNHLVRCNQEYIRDKYESLILSRFKEMRSLGRERTLDISMTNLAIITNYKNAKESAIFPSVMMA